MNWVSSSALFFVVYCAGVLFGEPTVLLKGLALVYSVGFLALSLFDSNHYERRLT